MRRIYVSLFIALAVIHSHSGVHAQGTVDRARKVECTSLTGLSLPNTSITEAVAVPAPSTGSSRSLIAASRGSSTKKRGLLNFFHSIGTGVFLPAVAAGSWAAWRIRRRRQRTSGIRISSVARTEAGRA